jgi:hypothetical protein
MLDSLIQSIENAFIQFSFRRLLYVLFVLAVVLSTAYAWNELTGYTYYFRLEKQVTLLERLNALERNQVSSSPTLAPLYTALVKQLLLAKKEPFAFHFDVVPIAKFFAAAVIPFIFVFVAMIQKVRGAPDWSDMLVGALTMTLLLGIPAALSPTFGSLLLTAVVYFVAQVVLLVWMAVFFDRRKRAKQLLESQGAA